MWALLGFQELHSLRGRWEECILTIDKLMRRDKIMVNGCFLCKREAKTCKHILLWCPKVYKLWIMVYGLMGISWVIASVRDELWVWEGSSKGRKIVNLIPLIIFRIVSKERNSRAFERWKRNVIKLRTYVYIIWGLKYNLEDFGDFINILTDF